MQWFERKHHAGRITWSYLTMHQLSPAAYQMYHFQEDPSTVIIISHYPSPKISSPSWIVQKRHFWRQASGRAPCSVTHSLVSTCDSKCPFYRPAWLMEMHTLHFTAHHTFLTAALPTFLPFRICFSHACDIG